ncbi:MAG: AAA family ATPase [Oceanospirillaceae bacterium]|uniref:AAA family ATPase n=1 Tax=unclassified Thalassolituus TaxID=2624967 RepID=UPI000C0B57B1|nr:MULTISPECIES: AAA family ATPase [unclassified Thalassolituus]MAK92098.1 AAA family ATPase [Thalassolituus sp.]MAX97736.1 AAA family ATPase [Oceanospirillaceae bacterium]MBL33908.1 AAA family ATPase [Oceanospirillaceae bacterium]MBS52867.1 AAA family ATPase [Oceanospirillaceae bacterium]|tara:strand:+ start:5813 stop:6913 length:1101 start_codon:yes stop_codon:yes gene_type:complete
MVFVTDMMAENNRKKAAESTSAAAVMSRFLFDPQQVEQQLREHIVGQDHAIASLRRQFNIIKAGLTDERRPLMTALFIGDTGVGKTEMVRCIARAIHGRADAFCRVDMNTLSQSHYSAAITGAPPGYVGSKDNLTVIDQELIEGSNSRPGIVLFDEIEKASVEVVRSLMNVLDNGMLTLASGQKALNFRNTLVFMTSNVGSAQWQQARRYHWLPKTLREKQRERMRQQALRRHFDAEFLNRIHCIETFAGLTDDSLPTILKLQIDALNQRLKKRRVTVLFSEQSIHWLCSAGYEQHYGARAIQRMFQQQVMAPLATTLLTTDCSSAVEIRADVKNHQLIFTPGPSPETGSTPHTTATKAEKGERNG